MVQILMKLLYTLTAVGFVAEVAFKNAQHPQNHVVQITNETILVSVAREFIPRAGVE